MKGRLKAARTIEKFCAIHVPGPISSGLPLTLELTFMLVRAGAVATRDGDIQETEEYAQLRPVMNDLAIGHPDDLALGRHMVDLFAVT